MQVGVRDGVLIDSVFPRLGTTVTSNRIIADALLIVGFALLVALCAQIAIRIPTTTVPITGQTFGVLLTGGVLGSRRGGLSMMLYMLLGVAAVPVFAPGGAFLDGKLVHFILPWNGNDGLIWDMASGGYIVGFVLAAYVVGLLAERGWDRRLIKLTLAMLVGNACVYLIGLPWLAAHIYAKDSLHSYYQSIYPGAGLLEVTLKGGLFPFIGGDLLKLISAEMVLPGAWMLVNKFKN